MARTRPLIAAFGLLLLGVGALACSPAWAQQDPADQAYYVVVLPAEGSGSSTLQISQVSDDSGTHVQVAGNLSVDCTRYPSAGDADAAAEQLHAGANWTVVIAPDALHALLIANGMSPDLAGLIPATPDADICRPDAT
ncbi:MAG TPA: hypothetical protein VFD32_22970 [Dehalococcoidia bacterium]|nr:hypothetical protein [Dehalococcoidia bacterium]